MAAIKGANVVVKIDSTAVAGGKTKNLTINNTAIDVTNDDSSGWRTMLDESGQQNVDITVSGILVNSDLIAASITGTVLETMSFEFPIALDGDSSSGPKLSGDFKMTSFATGAETEAGVTFDATFNSSGVIAYTAGA